VLLQQCFPPVLCFGGGSGASPEGAGSVVQVVSVLGRLHRGAAHHPSCAPRPRASPSLHKLLEEEEEGQEGAALTAPPGAQAQSQEQAGGGVEEPGDPSQGLGGASGEGSGVPGGGPGDSEDLRELLALPGSELERRCKLHGLSLRGGPRVMAARILSLDAADKARRQRRWRRRQGQRPRLQRRRQLPWRPGGG